MNYFDHAATSPMRREVLEKMTPFMLEAFGNPSSIHGKGREGAAEIHAVPWTLAGEVNAKPNELVFTSGGTESDNYAILGAASANEGRGRHVITTRTEHHAVLHAFEELERRGFEVTYLDVPESGVLELSELERALRDDTILVSVMFANNEIGAIQPIGEIGQLLKDRDVLFHTDAVQAFGKLEIDVAALQVDLLSASAHKVNGPKGVGLLYVRNGAKVAPQTFGGEQERKRRAGTENVPGIVGFAEAVRIAAEERTDMQAEFSVLREKLFAVLDRNDVRYELNGSEGLRHIVNLHFEGIEIEPFLIMLDMRGFAVSSGSACTAGSIEPSHVLSAMYGEQERTRQSVRISFGYGNDASQVELLAQALSDVVKSFQVKSEI